MKVRLCQLDGKLPNLALMRLASWHRAQGDRVAFYSGADAVQRHLDEPAYDRVYASAIFRFSAPLIERFRAQWPEAILGGTGTDSGLEVEEIVGDHAGLDYSFWPRFPASIGFTQRGCRLKCKFCVVPKKEGANRSVATIADIWRGTPYPKRLHLLDNDFFGQAEWPERIVEIRDGSFEVCFSQGINVRAMTDDVAAALATIRYRNTDFDTRRLYTAWDNFGDGEVFFTGVDRLERAGVPSRHLMAYMLIGFDKAETWERIQDRFDRMVERSIKPYPMVFDPPRNGLDRARLKAFQRYAIFGVYRRGVPFDAYDVGAKRGAKPKGAPLLEGLAA